METPLQNASPVADDLNASILPDYEEDLSEGESHIHLPGPSFWPLVLGVAIVITVGGFLFIDSTPVVVIVGAIFVLIGILGFGMENPMAQPQDARAAENLNLSSQDILDRAEGIVESMVTIGSTAWSAHPVEVEIEQESEGGIVLALYGKVELEAQRDALEAELRTLPRVIEVRNFVVAEDAILNSANERITRLQAEGKLDGTRNLTLQVENYIISLYGEVPTKSMKYMLENELINIPGVRVVVNHIGLDEEIPGNLGRTKNKVGK